MSFSLVAKTLAGDSLFASSVSDFAFQWCWHSAFCIPARINREDCSCTRPHHRQECVGSQQFHRSFDKRCWYRLLNQTKKRVWLFAYVYFERRKCMSRSMSGDDISLQLKHGLSGQFSEALFHLFSCEQLQEGHSLPADRKISFLLSEVLSFCQQTIGNQMIHLWYNIWAKHTGFFAHTFLGFPRMFDVSIVWLYLNHCTPSFLIQNVKPRLHHWKLLSASAFWL